MTRAGARGAKARARWRDTPADGREIGPDLCDDSAPWPSKVGQLSPVARGAPGVYRWRCSCGRAVVYREETVLLLATLPRDARCPRCWFDSPERRALEEHRAERARARRARDAAIPPIEAPAAPRCGAWARSAGRPCVAAALKSGRCKNHGGASTGPRTAEGLAHLSAAVRAWWARWRACVALDLPEAPVDLEGARAWLAGAGAADGRVRLALDAARADAGPWRTAARELGVPLRSVRRAAHDPAAATRPAGLTTPRGPR